MRTTALIMLTAMGLVFLAPAQQPTPDQAAAEAAQQAAAQVAQQAAQQDAQPADPNGLPPALETTKPGPVAQPKAGETVTTFKSNSYLVIVDVEATDKSGNPIQNLRKEDFTVTEDGKKQDISIFQFQELTQESEPPEELKLSDELKLPEAPKTELTSPTPGQLHFKDKRLMVFYMDFSSMQIPEQLRAQDAALDYLKKFITKDDLVAIVPLHDHA